MTVHFLCTRFVYPFTFDNMHSVTSNAVAQQLDQYLKKNTFTTFKLLTPDYSRYILIADVSTWYNSNSPDVTQTYTMVGLLMSYRASGNDRTECAMITLSVGYYRAGNSLPNDNLMHVKMSGTSGLYYRCCIIRYNNKEYLAIKLLTDQSRYNQFIGYVTDTPLYTVLNINASVTELYVN